MREQLTQMLGNTAIDRPASGSRGDFQQMRVGNLERLSAAWRSLSVRTKPCHAEFHTPAVTRGPRSSAFFAFGARTLFLLTGVCSTQHVFFARSTFC